MLDGHEQSVEPKLRLNEEGRHNETAENKTEPSGAAGAPSLDVRSRLGHAALGLVALLALGFGGTYAYSWWTLGRYLVTTDDAYVGVRSATLSPKISGYIVEIAVEDNAQVTKG